MRRNIFLASFATVTLAAVPAFAAPAGHGGHDLVPAPVQGKVSPRNAPGDHGVYDKRTRRKRGGPIAAPTPILPAPTIPMPTVTGYSPSSAKPGTVITIRGRRFAAGTRVILGGMAIAPTRVSRRAIQFTVPAGAVDGALALDVPGKRRNFRIGSFDVIEVVKRPRRRQWRQNRVDRRNNSRRAVLAKWSSWAFLRSPAAKKELSLHAKRSAKLSRIKHLISELGRPALTVRINVAIRRENSRHASAMKSLEKSYIAAHPRTNDGGALGYR